MARLMDLPDSKSRRGFKYVPAVKTNIRETFRRERARLEAIKAEAIEDKERVTSIERAKK